MRVHRVVPVSVAALTLVLTLGSSAVGSQVEKHTPTTGGTGGMLTATQPALTPLPTKATQPGSTTPSKPVPKSTATATSRSDPVTPEAKALVVFAKQFNGPAFERAMDDSEPSSIRPGDTYEVSKAYWNSSRTMWSDLMDRFRLKGSTPKFKPLVYNAQFEDEEGTGCARLNNDQETVKSSSPRPFYCPADGPNGTLYWPIKGIEKRWRASGVSGPVAESGLLIQMYELFGEAMADKAYMTYPSLAEPLSQPMAPQIAAVGYCFAGTALQGSYRDRTAALAGTAMLFPHPSGEQQEYARALAFGFDSNSLGKCVAEFWPRS